jgi:hypothetical protein
MEPHFAKFHTWIYRCKRAHIYCSRLVAGPIWKGSSSNRRARGLLRRRRIALWRFGNARGSILERPHGADG